jgi:toxin HigB-1
MFHAGKWMSGTPEPPQRALDCQENCNTSLAGIAYRYTLQFGMIISFRHKGLECFHRTGSKRGIQAAHAPKLNRILGLLDVAMIPDDLDLPAFRLHPLKGELQGYWSIWVNGNWRVTFRFVGSDVELVDYQDYH